MVYLLNYMAKKIPSRKKGLKIDKYIYVLVVEAS
jgi:hypothetical protein